MHIFSFFLYTLKQVFNIANTSFKVLFAVFNFALTGRFVSLKAFKSGNHLRLSIFCVLCKYLDADLLAGVSSTRTSSQACNGHSCPEWSSWMTSSCSVSCGGGTQARTSTCYYQEQISNLCEGQRSRRRACLLLDVIISLKLVMYRDG